MMVTWPQCPQKTVDSASRPPTLRVGDHAGVDVAHHLGAVTGAVAA